MGIELDLYPELDELLSRAKKNRASAYGKYSDFPVGAVVRLGDGSVFDGCSMENGSFPVGICAERSALTAALVGGAQAGASDTPTMIAMVVVVGPDGKACSPCGACRQAILELAPEALVAYLGPSGEQKVVRAEALLPDAFILHR